MTRSLAGEEKRVFCSWAAGSFMVIVERANRHAMEDVVKRLLGLARVAIQVEQRVEPARAADNLLVRADASRLRREIGWQPRIPLEQTLADTLNYWRQQP